MDERALEQLRFFGRKFEAYAGRVEMRPAIDVNATPIGFPIPTAEAMTLSLALARGALPKLRHWNVPFRFASGDEQSIVRDEIPLEYATLGFPLYGATAPGDRAEDVRRQIATRQARTRKEWIAKELNKVIANEYALWSLADEPRVPYGFAFHAHVWLGPGVYEEGNRERVLLCLQCGALIRPERTTKEVPRCADCSTKAARTIPWPEHAVMPAERGNWWLRCKDESCTRVFIGRRQAQFCPNHRSAKTAPRARRAKS